jgi:hypothetical protein
MTATMDLDVTLGELLDELGALHSPIKSVELVLK